MFGKMRISLRPVFLVAGILAYLLLAAPATEHGNRATPARADYQSQTCNDVIDSALQLTGNVCLGVGRNEVCYGHSRVSASLATDSVLFAAPGDIIPVTALDTLVTYPFNPDTQEWGVAIMDIQADLPVESEHSMRLVVMGGVNVIPDKNYQLAGHHFSCSGVSGHSQAVNIRSGPGVEYTAVGVLERQERLEFTGRNIDGNWLYSAHGWVETPLADINCVNQLPVMGTNNFVPRAPMQSFVVQINEEAHCQSAPSGLLIQTPAGMVGNVRINNVDVRIGSTAFVRTTDNGASLAISNLEGEVIVRSQDHLQAVPVGSETHVVLDEEGQAAGVPGPPQRLTDLGVNLPPQTVDLLPERTFRITDDGVQVIPPGEAISEDARDNLPDAVPDFDRPTLPGDDDRDDDDRPDIDDHGNDDDDDDDHDDHGEGKPGDNDRGRGDDDHDDDDHDDHGEGDPDDDDDDDEDDDDDD
jgi:hypothetical protein